MAILLVSCKDAKLITARYIDSQSNLKLDGCYIEAVPSKYHNSSVYFFYSNGTVLYLGLLTNIELENRLNESVTEEYHKLLTRRPGEATHWGAVNIQNSKIVFEIWTPSSGGGAKTLIHRGNVLNDTTFVINEHINNYENGKKYMVKDTFHFKYFMPKPDSTNQFVK